VVKRTLGGILRDQITQRTSQEKEIFLRNKMLQCIIVLDFFSGPLCAVPVYLQWMKCEMQTFTCYGMKMLMQ